MLLIYRLLINLTYIFSPFILIFRLIKRKENFESYLQKIGLPSKKRVSGNLLWFHGASVGEIQSIIPILEKFEDNKKIHQILITSNTLSSSKIIKKLKLKKVIHQFFPIDANIISKKFINYWKPSKAFFIDSEIWPNTILNLKKKQIPITLLNGRITKKTFQRWNLLPNFAYQIISNFDLCLSSNNETYKFLSKFKPKKLKFIGNLKFTQSENKIYSIDQNLKNFLNKKKLWCASSTHKTEEIFCANAHAILKKRYKNLLTIIIPRHIERSNEIKENLEKMKLKVHLDEPKKKVKIDTDIYLVNSYGKTKTFYKNCSNVFLGGSLISHGGQNPLEAVRYGCNIFHGPNVQNFKEIYDFLKRKKISIKINKLNELTKNLSKYFLRQNKSRNKHKEFKNIGLNILNKTYKEINL